MIVARTVVQHGFYAETFGTTLSFVQAALRCYNFSSSIIANAGAIVCAHVAAGEPILRATRDNPMDPDDSGWQFLCDSGADERIEDAQIWSVTQVAEREPSLLPFINSPVGTTMSRTDADSEWKPSQ